MVTDEHEWIKDSSEIVLPCGKYLTLQGEWVKSLSCIRLFETPWTVAYETPLSIGFSRQEYWSGLPFLSPGDLPDPGIEPGSPVLQADSLPIELQSLLIPIIYFIQYGQSLPITLQINTLSQTMALCLPKTATTMSPTTWSFQCNLNSLPHQEVGSLPLSLESTWACASR